MSEIIYKTDEELLEKAKNAIGISFSEMQNSYRLESKKNKGSIGNLVEECCFGRAPNSRPEPDIAELGIEIKVTPFKIIKNNEIRAKERLSLNVFSYHEEHLRCFEESSFWLKNKKILMLFYKYQEGINKEDFFIEKFYLNDFNLTEKDKNIIKNDWEKIVSKIKEGKAHEISEKDTLYLGACRKGSGGTKEKKVSQPNNPNINAYRKAFCLKQPYMTYILNNYVFQNQKYKDTQAIKNPEILKNQSFEDYIVAKISKYFGWTKEELIEEFCLKINPNAKNFADRIIASILGVKGNISNSEEFKKAGITLKTIRVENNNIIQQHMSFPPFDFREIVQEEWEGSSIYNLFAPEITKFLFVIFKYDKQNRLKLHNVMFWSMPVEDLEEVYKVWLKTRDIINNGVKITVVPHGKGTRDLNNFPNPSDNRVSHIRPKGENKKHHCPLPNGGSFTQQCFWLHRKYILNQISKLID